MLNSKLLKQNILFCLSGSIASYKACEVISSLVKSGHDVQCLLTSGGEKFIGPATLEGLTSRPVLCSPFQPNHLMDHIHLTKWADKLIICPASANTINRLAAGLADDLVGCLCLAMEEKSKIYIAPAMNTHMYQSPITQTNLKKLSEWGMHVLPTGFGNMACKDTGYGRLLEPKDILSHIFSVQKNEKKVLITGGGTIEPLDGVRCISNFSTGKTAAAIARHLALKGYEVTFLCGTQAESSGFSGDLIRFSSANDLSNKMQTLLMQSQFDVVLHAAAVSDYTVDRIVMDGQVFCPDSSKKLSSVSSGMQIFLKASGKILPQIKAWSCGTPIVIGFKLTNQATPAEQTDAVIKLFQQGTVDYIVHNDLAEITDARHTYRIFSDSEIISQGLNKFDLAEDIHRLISKQFSNCTLVQTEVTL